MPKLSVVMPALNVKNYIESCITSVQGQSLAEIEMIVVDAGSTDGTLDILMRKAAEDSRIKIIHSDIKSYGYQVNLGIREAKGEYVAILETDDMVPQNGYERLYQEAKATNADYVKGEAEFFWENENGTFLNVRVGLYFETTVNGFYKKKVTLWPKETPEIILKDIFLWNGIYKRSFIENIKLNETKGAAYQDHGFSIDALSRAEKGVYIPMVVYKYRQDNIASSIKSTNGLKYLYGEYELNYPKVRKLDNDWKDVYFQRMLEMLVERFRGMARQNNFWDDSRAVMALFQKAYQNALDSRELLYESLSQERQMELDLFLKDPYMLYEKKCADIKEKKQLVREMNEKLAERKVVIFGAGRIGKFLAVRIRSVDQKNLVAYCDNAKGAQGSVCQGVPVLSPEEATCLYPDAIYVIAGRRDEKEMRDKLRENGIKEECIYTYTGGFDTEILKIQI